MLSDELRKLLIAQIGNELAAHQLYFGIALYFERQSLDGWAKLFRDQSVEEAQHAAKIMDFLTDNEVEFDLPALKATSTRFASPLAAAKRALESERTVAGQFDKMAAVAAANATTVGTNSSSGSSRSRSRRRRSSNRSSTSSAAASTCSRRRPCWVGSSNGGH